MKLNIKKDPEYRFGFGVVEADGKVVDISDYCTSGHGHCWVQGPTLLSYPPIRQYYCEHCHANKKVVSKRLGGCKYR